MATQSDPSCTECTDNETMALSDETGEDRDRPTGWWHCQACGVHMDRWRGQGDQTCDCGAEYNASGQRLRDDWRSNPAWDDDDIDDMT